MTLSHILPPSSLFKLPIYMDEPLCFVHFITTLRGFPEQETLLALQHVPLTNYTLMVSQLNNDTLTFRVRNYPMASNATGGPHRGPWQSHSGKKCRQLYGKKSALHGLSMNNKCSKDLVIIAYKGQWYILMIFHLGLFHYIILLQL